MKSKTVSIPEIFSEIFAKSRYKVYYGGRGGGKSWAVASALLIIALQRKVRILCTRELQKTISDSVHKLLSDLITRNDFTEYFIVQKNTIQSINGSEFIFSGLRSNITEIKSMEGIDICWLEEAQKVSEESFQVLIPTIRKEGSEIWITFNPDDEDDPVYQRFINHPPKDAIIKKVNWSDNPYFTETLKKELEYDKSIDYDKYVHVWEGETRKIKDALVMANKYVVDVFEAPDDILFYYGADWGFANDPTTLIRCFIIDDILYIDYNCYGVGVDIDKTPEMFDQVPGSRDWTIIADSARPETISYMNQHGFNISAARKGAGSVEDGIQFIRSFRQVVIHERCHHVLFEFANYSYKRNKQTDQITPLLEDRHNHTIDALRYALEPLMKNKKLFIGFAG